VVKGIAHTGSTRVYDVDSGTAVVVKGRTEVITTLAVWGPGWARVGGVVSYN